MITQEESKLKKIKDENAKSEVKSKSDKLANEGHLK